MDNRSNMLQLCRLCLVKDDVNIPIFEEHGDIRQIFLKITSCLPVKVSRDDKLPKKICDGCSYKLETLYEFWNTSVNAEKQLLAWLGEAGMNSEMADGTITAVAQQIKPTDTFVKQETVDPPDVHSEDHDQKDYVFQQKFESASAGPSATVTSNEEEEPPPKRARRTAAVKAAIAMDRDSDDDDDSGEPITKVEDESEESDGEDHTFADAPSTSADDQPGPSGVGKDGVDAPIVPMILNPSTAISAAKFDVTRCRRLMYSLPQRYSSNTSVGLVAQNNNSKGAVRTNIPQFGTPHSYNIPRPIIFLNSLPQIQTEILKLSTQTVLVPINLLAEHHKITQSAITTLSKYKNPFDYSLIKSTPVEANSLSTEPKSEETNDDPMICRICGESKKDKTTLLDHYEFHKMEMDNAETTDNIYEADQHIECPVCRNKFKSKYAYEKHVEDQHKTKDFYCEICKRMYANAYTMSIHDAKHSSNPSIFECWTCKSFSTTESEVLNNHIYIQHEKDNEFFCETCGKTFNSKTWFHDHQQFHLEKKLLYCAICERYFKHQRLLVVHNKKYHQHIEKTIKLFKHQCQICKFTFPHEDNLEIHMKYHKKNSFLCNFCGKTFSDSRNLSLHLRIHKETKDFVCSTCGKAFVKHDTLKLHLRTHTGEKPHKCHICGKCFSQRSPLRAHLRNHTGDKPYSCDRCEKRFVTKSAKLTHAKTCKA